jgi:hypothetical protein
MTSRKARRQHRCNWCGGTIERGEVYEHEKHIHDGKISEWKSHRACSHVASAIWEFVDPYDDEMSSGGFKEGCSEVCQTFICPGCPNHNGDSGGCKEGKSFCIDRMDDFFKTHELYRIKDGRSIGFWQCREIGRKG